MAKLAVDCWAEIIDSILQKCYKYYIRDVINMLEKIDVLREKLEQQVITNRPYNEILSTSEDLDKLIVEYYKNMESYNIVVEV